MLTSPDMAWASGLARALGARARVWQVHRLPAHIGTLIDQDARPVVVADEVDPFLIDAMREQWPKLRLIVRQAEPAAGMLDAMLTWRARGWLDPKASIDDCARAIRIVAEGGFWAPRRVVAELFDRSMPKAVVPGAPVAAAQAPGAAAAWRAPASVEPAEELTTRERAALLLVQQGMSNKEIAREMQVSFGTVKKHVAQAFRKLGVHRRRQFIG